MTISELYKKKQINLRLHNICVANDLRTFKCVQNHYLKYQTFSNLKGCGKKSNAELKGFYLSLRKVSNHPDSSIKGSCLLDSLAELDPKLSKTLDQLIQISFLNLSSRAQKSLVTYLGSIPELEIFKQKILSRSFSIFNLQDAGQKTINEISNYIEKVINFIELLDGLELIEHRNDRILAFLHKNIFPFNNLTEKVIKSRSIFKIVKYLLDKNILFNKNQDLVFQKANKLYKSEAHIEYDGLARELGTTLERVRHLRRVSLEKLEDKFQFVRFIQDEILEKFKSEEPQEIINVDTKLQEELNYRNGTNFSTGFIAILMSVYLSEYYELIGDENRTFAKILSLNIQDDDKIYRLERK